MTRTSYRASLSSPRPIRDSCKGTVGPTPRPSPISRFRRTRLTRYTTMMSIVRWLPLLAAANIWAHDMWIEPAAFCPAAGQIVGVRLRVGQDFIGDPLPRDPALVREFVFEDAEGRKPLIGRSGSDPAGFFRIAAAGLHVVG